MLRLSSSLLLLALLLGLTACAPSLHKPAPVTDISSKSEYATASSQNRNASASKSAPAQDWRPDLYIVKKGDTLYSIGLEHGFDYREIAQDNQIEAPYVIKIGQGLKLKNLKGKEKTLVSDGKTDGKKLDGKKADANLEGGAVTRPLEADGAAPQGHMLNEAINGKPLADDSKPMAANNANGANNKDNKLTTAPAATTGAATSPVGGTTGDAPAANTGADINDKLAPQSRNTPRVASNSTVAASSNDWSWPTKGKVINPFSEGSSAKGIDIEGVLGQEVNAAANGKVIYNGGDLRGYGNMVIIKHDKDLLSVYAHNSKTLVKEGQMITKGQKIAEMGSSGTDKVKLHFEIRFQGKSVDPIKYLGNLVQ